MDIPEEKKIDVLLSALNARYSALDRIRDRVENICLWAIGLQLAAAGWLLQADPEFTCTKKGLLVIGLGISVWIIQFKYFGDIHTGFRNQQRAAAHIETILELYTKDVYGNAERVYPENWKDAGGPASAGRYFDRSYFLLWTGTLGLATAIIFS